jgi:hypothetical protein
MTPDDTALLDTLDRLARELDAAVAAHEAAPDRGFAATDRLNDLAAARTAYHAFCTSDVALRLVALARQGAEDAARIDWLEQRTKLDEAVVLGWSRADHDYDEFSGRNIVWPESFWVDDESAVEPPHLTLRDGIDSRRAVLPLPDGGPTNGR